MGEYLPCGHESKYFYFHPALRGGLRFRCIACDDPNRNSKFMQENPLIVPMEKIPRKTEDCPIDKPMDLFKICHSMEELCDREKGIGLAAVQIGLPWKLFIVKKESGYEYFVNCDYKPLSEETMFSLEGCLSLKKAGRLNYFRVKRFPKIRVFGKRLVVTDTVNLEDVDFVSEGDIYTVVYQHEIQHQLGILISEIGEEVEVW